MVGNVGGGCPEQPLDVIGSSAGDTERPFAGIHPDDVVGTLDEWSARCVAARAFPPDVFKRAAG